MSLSIEDVRAIASLHHDNIDLSEDAIPSKMIEVFINTLTSKYVTPEERPLVYFIRKKSKSKTLSTWQERKDGQTKIFDQFYTRKVFEDPIDTIGLPQAAVILPPHC